MSRLTWPAFAGVQALTVVGAWLWLQTHHPLGNLLAGDAELQLLAWGRLAGLLAAFLILLQAALISRVRSVGRAFGFDRLTHAHHVLGFALAALLALHPVLITLGHAKQADVGYFAQTLDFWKNWRGVAAAIVGTALLLAALVPSALVLLKRMRYEAWHASHLVVYVGAGLAFLHQVASGSDFTDHPAFRFYWCALSGGVLAALLHGRLVHPLALLRRHRFTVQRVVAESDDVVSVTIGGRDLQALRAEAGQFVIVRFLAPGFRWEAHPFSLSRAPGGDALRLSIKRLGDFTRRIPELKPGTPVVVDGPHGRLTLRACRSDKLLLIAGGIGITPVRALAEEAVAAGRDTLLVYGNRTAAGIVFRQELEALSAASGGRLRVTNVLSHEPEWAGERGYVDRERLARLAPDIRERDVVLCGPPPMMAGVRRALSELGVPAAHVHCERFAL